MHSDICGVHSPTNALLLIKKTHENLHENTHKYRFYMFRSSTIIRELALNLAKVIFMLKHSVKLRRYVCLRLCGSMLLHISKCTVQQLKKKRRTKFQVYAFLTFASPLQRFDNVCHFQLRRAHVLTMPHWDIWTNLRRPTTAQLGA